MPLGPAPAANVPSTAPASDSLVTLLLPKFAVQILVPSNAIPVGSVPTGKVPRIAPAVDILMTLAAPLRVTHTLVPSNTTPAGLVPAVNVPNTAPVLAFSLVTLLLPSLATQIFVPSKARASG